MTTMACRSAVFIIFLLQGIWSLPLETSDKPDDSPSTKETSSATNLTESASEVSANLQTDIDKMADSAAAAGSTLTNVPLTMSSDVKAALEALLGSVYDSDGNIVLDMSAIPNLGLQLGGGAINNAIELERAKLALMASGLNTGLNLAGGLSAPALSYLQSMLRLNPTLAQYDLNGLLKMVQGGNINIPGMTREVSGDVGVSGAVPSVGVDLSGVSNQISDNLQAGMKLAGTGSNLEMALPSLEWNLGGIPEGGMNINSGGLNINTGLPGVGLGFKLPGIGFGLNRGGIGSSGGQFQMGSGFNLPTVGFGGRFGGSEASMGASGILSGLRDRLMSGIKASGDAAKMGIDVGTNTAINAMGGTPGMKLGFGLNNGASGSSDVEVGGGSGSGLGGGAQFGVGFGGRGLNARLGGGHGSGITFGGGGAGLAAGLGGGRWGGGSRLGGGAEAHGSSGAQVDGDSQAAVQVGRHAGVNIGLPRFSVGY